MSRGARYLDDLDLSPLLTRADGGSGAVHCTVEGRNEVPDTLDAQMIRDAQPLFTHREKMQLQYSVRNTHRAVGTRLAAMITRKYGMAGLQPDTVTVRLRGTAGQSLGAFAVQGMKLEVFGDANDYVGKGLSAAAPSWSSRRFRARWCPSTMPSSATRFFTVPRPASCSPRAAPASASPCATPAPTRSSKARAQTAAST